MQNKKVFIIILHYDDYKNLRTVIRNVLRLRMPKNADITTLVVDNASVKKKLITSVKGFRNVQILPLNKNYGFSGGMNRGLRYAIRNEADYMLLTSPDLYMEEDVLIKLFRRIGSNKKLAAVCPKILTKTNPPKIFFVGGKFDRKRKTPIHIGLNEEDKNQYDYFDETEFLNLPILVKKHAIKKVGYLDESYFLYYEDMDWYTHFKRFDFELECVKNAIAWNSEPKINDFSNSKKTYYLSRNYLYFLTSNFSTSIISIALVYEIRDIIFFFVQYILNLRHRRGAYSFFQLLGVKDFLLRKKGEKLFL